MKIKLDSKELLERLQYLSGVVLSNNTMPILDNFLFEFGGKKLIVTASDLDNTMISKMDIESECEGSIAIPSKMLLEILKLLPQQPIELNIQENNLIEIVSSSGNYSISYQDGKEFPKSTELQNPASFTLATDTLQTAITKTVFACGSDDLRPVMSGVLFQLQKDRINFVATDAHRLAKYTRKDISSETEIDFIVPKKPLGILKSILGSTPELEVTIEYNQNNASFKFGDYELKSRLIDAKYPNYEAVIPKENPNQFTIDTKVLISSLKRVSIFSNKTTHQVAVKRIGTALNITAEDKDYSTNGTETLQCEPVGGDIAIGFNARFLSEVLNYIDDTEVRIETSAPNRAGIVRPVSEDENEELLMLVMPVMLTN